MAVVLLRRSALLGVASGALLALSLIGAAPPAAADIATRFTIVNPDGAPQFAHYLVEQSGASAPTQDDWFGSPTTPTPGQVTIPVTAGETVYFNRTDYVYAPNGHRVLTPPEGVTGQPYPVPSSPPSTAQIELPTTGAAYRPQLSGAERWLLGQLNERRKALGAPKLQVSTTLDAAASEEARDEALNHRFPDPYVWAIPQDRGWPGDVADETRVTADAPFTDPQRVLRHWDGDPSDSESPAIWNALKDSTLRYVGIGDGTGAWIIEATDACPSESDAAACGLTTDTGDTAAWQPTDIEFAAPAAGATYGQNEQVPASYTCTAPQGNGVAIAGCDGTVAVGAPIPTGATGSHTFKVIATDVDGDTTTASVNYTVVPDDTTSLTVSAPASVRYGAHVSIEVSAQDTTTGTPLADQPVVLYRRAGTDASWTEAGTVTTAADGSAQLPTVMTTRERFQYRYAGSGLHHAATSGAAVVQVRQVVAAHATATKIKHGKSVTIWGTVRPAGAGKSVGLQRLTGGSWQPIGSATLTKQRLPNGKTTVGYVITTTLRAAGSYSLRVHKAATSTLQAGDSPPLRIRAT